MKKKQIKPTEKEQSFYVGVQNPADVRKTMLEASRELLLSLKQYEHLRNIRAQKLSLYSQYQSEISAIKSLLAKLQRAVPKHDMALLTPPKQKEDIPEQAIASAPAKTASPRASRVSTDHVAAMDEVTRLESELAEIEKKLSSM